MLIHGRIGVRLMNDAPPSPRFASL